MVFALLDAMTSETNCPELSQTSQAQGVVHYKSAPTSDSSKLKGSQATYPFDRLAKDTGVTLLLQV